MATNTYVALDKVTVGTATGTISFNSIPQGYTDLIIVAKYGTSGSGNSMGMRFNGDTGSNYSITTLYGTGSSALSDRASNQSYSLFAYNITSSSSSTLDTQTILNIQNYSNTTTNKTVLERTASIGSAYPGTEAGVTLWRNTAAITSLQLISIGYTFQTGSTFSLYGIAAASVGAKATGGTVYSDDQYYYHVFGSTGTFTPLQSLSVDALVIAGGGGGGGSASGGYNGGGGGGAGGLLGLTSQSLSATGYTVTVGGGGAGGNPGIGTQGSSSVFNSNLTCGFTKGFEVRDTIIL